MAKHFTAAQWDLIEAELASNPQRYGMPEGMREESMVFASFNIRKLGKVGQRKRALDFMARFCARCDLVAIQEVQDDLEALEYLRTRIDQRVASSGEFGLLVSDITGEVPGESGMAERLAFLYRVSRVRRMEMTSDLSIDRTGVLNAFADNEQAFADAWQAFKEQQSKFAAGERKTKPTLSLPKFLTFTRTPYVAAFEVPAANGAKPVRFVAVNAHLIYGKPKDREEEFKALLRWMTNRLLDEKRMVAPNFVLMGDLNLDFDKPRKDRQRIEKFIRDLNKSVFGNVNAKRVYFPFIDPDPVTGKQIRTNARQSQTFDHIAFLLGRRETGLPNDLVRGQLDVNNPDSFSYGVFNFAELFARALKDSAYLALDKDERVEFGKSFEHSVSDHLPIWVRVPRPGF